MKHTAYVKTIDFGYVPIRKTHTEGFSMMIVELSDFGYADIRRDYRTNQPFAVLLDEELNEIVNE